MRFGKDARDYLVTESWLGEASKENPHCGNNAVSGREAQGVNSPTVHQALY